MVSITLCLLGCTDAASSAVGLFLRACQSRQTDFLLTVSIEVFGGEPFVEAIFEPWPIPVQDGVPSRVAVASFVDKGLVEQPVIGEPQPFRRTV